jgi:hypothetical protein
MAQQILEINDSESKWIGDNLQTTKNILQIVLGEERDDWLTPAHLDAAYSAWLSIHQRGVGDPNPMINAFGIAFGQYLVDIVGLEWKAVSDDYGTEIAVYGKPGNIIVFPTNLVAKRYEKNETGFFEPLFTNLNAQIEKVLRANGQL